MSTGIYVQYGCGWDAPEGWLNYDGSPTLWVERLPIFGKALSLVLKRNAALFPSNVQFGDIVKGLPLSDGSSEGVYCSHVLEHLSLEDFRLALKNTMKVLFPGGVFRGVLPDLAHYVRAYVESDSPDAALTFMTSTGLGESVRARGGKAFVKEFLGGARHRWMWDYPSLERELSNAGFENIRRAEFGDSSYKKFCEVERKGRWENCLGFECQKKPD